MHFTVLTSAVKLYSAVQYELQDKLLSVKSGLSTPAKTAFVWEGKDAGMKERSDRARFLFLEKV